MDDLALFIAKSPTPWHACQTIKESLKDFVELKEADSWNLSLGKSYFIQRGGAIAAFRLPKKEPVKAKILGAHTDSPALKIKPKPEVRTEEMVSLLVDIFGGPILASWLNRDLAIAGKILTQKGEEDPKEELIYLSSIPCTIPALAIHLDREVNTKGLILDKQKHLLPLVALGTKEEISPSYLEHAIKKCTGLDFDRIISHDLFLVPIEAPRKLGLNGEMLAAPRLDNLGSCHSCLHAITSAAVSEDSLNMAFFWNHEEIGSLSSEGAHSPFFNDCLMRISLALKIEGESFYKLKSRSLCLSVDMSHAHHPNYADISDPNHKDSIGKGIQIKHSSGLKYATTATSSAPIIALCLRKKIPFQLGAGRSDMVSGSTIGSIFAGALGIETMDMGVPLLSMHSTRELIALKDHEEMGELLHAFLEEK